MIIVAVGLDLRRDLPDHWHPVDTDLDQVCQVSCFKFTSACYSLGRPWHGLSFKLEQRLHVQCLRGPGEGGGGC
jgi:hypothetical protein